MPEQRINISMESGNDSATIDSGWYIIENKTPKIVAFCVLFVISVFGNSFIIWTITKDRRLKYTTNLLVANMAVSDLVTTLFAVPLRIVEVVANDRLDVFIKNRSTSRVLCKIVPFIFELSRAVSIYSCVAIAIDRHRAVVFPMKRGFSHSRLKYIIPGIWLYAGLLSAPFLYFIDLLGQHCASDSKYFIKFLEVHLSSVNFVPLPIITLIYFSIVYKLKTQKIPGLQQNDLVRKKRHEQNMKVLKMSVAVVSVLYVTYALNGTVTFLLYNRVFDHMINEAFNAYIDLRFTMILIINVSFCYNFFIYLIFNRVYRENFKKLFAPCCAVQAEYIVGDREMETPA